MFPPRNIGCSGPAPAPCAFLKTAIKRPARPIVAWGFLACSALGIGAAAHAADDLAGVPEETYAEFMAGEVLDVEDLAEGAEIQRLMFNRITPPGMSWLQPMFPTVVPFDAAYFEESFLDNLLGEARNSVAVYPLSLALDPKTRDTLVYNADGKLIAAIPTDKASRAWPEDADPSRVTLQLNLLPAEDVEPYLYVEGRIAETLAARVPAKSPRPGGLVRRSLGGSEFGICDIQHLTNGNVRLTVTNGPDVAELYAYTVAHTSSVVVGIWTNEEDEVIWETNVVWTAVSPSFDGIDSAWECATTNLACTNGVGAWEDADISTNARVRFYAVAQRTDSDVDGLTDGAEIFLHRTDPEDSDTDGDDLSDGDEANEHGTNPLDSDTDDDGLTDGEEANDSGTDPLVEDTDRDGLPDGWEVASGFNPSSGMSSELAAWYRFDEGTGVAIQNSASGIYTGVLLNATAGFTNWVAGYTGQTNDRALWFDGTNDYVAVSTNGCGSVVTQAPFTVSAWVFQDPLSTNRMGPIVSDSGFKNYNYCGYLLRTDAHANWNSAGFYVGCSSNWAVCLQRGWTNSWMGRWVQLVGTYDGTDLKLYANGSLIETSQAHFQAETNAALWIGRGHVDAGFLWRGAIDDVRIYRGALSTQEVADLNETFADADSDGLSNQAEYQAETDPRNSDSDDDGLTDGEEVSPHGTDPLDADTDHDGWSDAEELVEGTSPLNRFDAPRLARGVVINEVLYNDGTTEQRGEWIELYSTGIYPVDLDGFQIEAGDVDFSPVYTLTNVFLHAGQTLLLGGSNVVGRDQGPDDGFGMPNRGYSGPTAAVRLVATNHELRVVDCLMYGGIAPNFNSGDLLDTTGWISDTAYYAAAGSSLFRWFPGYDTDQAGDWHWTNSPTPMNTTNVIDTDDDGLTDQEELTGSQNFFGEPTNPYNPDSDGDGLGDCAECKTNQTNPNAWATDGDIFPWPPKEGGVTNWPGSDSYEIAHDWNPHVADQNSNGIPDSLEMACGDLYIDSDNDTVTNWFEILQNSNPLDSNSFVSQSMVLQFESSTGEWENNQLQDVGLKGEVKVYFKGFTNNTDICLWIAEGSNSEPFTVTWSGVTNGAVTMVDDQHAIASATLLAGTSPSLLIQDNGVHPDYTDHLGGEYKIDVLKVETAFADPDDANWADLAEEKVILSDKDTRIKIKVTPQLADLQTIFYAIGTTVKIRSSGTAPNGQDFTMTSQNTTLVQGSGYSELRVALTRSQLISLGVLPSQENDSVTEKAWHDSGSTAPGSESTLVDGQAFDAGMSAESRGQSTSYGDLNSSPPNSPLDESFILSAGREIITAECCSDVSDKRQIMNQADYFYYSGHGTANGFLNAGGGISILHSDVAPYWQNNDLDIVVIAGCAVLDINDYNGNGAFIPGAGGLYPGEYWEQTGPSILLGYNYLAPNDLQNSDGIISSWLSNRGSLGNIGAWEEANDNMNGHNACAIEAGSTYYYFEKTEILGVSFWDWTSVPKSSW